MKTPDLTVIQGDGERPGSKAEVPLELLLDLTALLTRSGTPLDQMRSDTVAKALRGMSDAQVATLLEQHILAEMWMTEPLAEIVNTAIERLHRV